MHLALSVPQKFGPKAVAMSSRQSVRESRSGSQAEIWFYVSSARFFQAQRGTKSDLCKCFGRNCLM
jgi:hypothetical protein